MALYYRDHTVLPATQTFIHKSNEQYLLYSPASPHFAWYSFPVPLKVGGWVNLGGLILRWFARLKTVTHPSCESRRPGIELVTIESRVQPTRLPSHPSRKDRAFQHPSLVVFGHPLRLLSTLIPGDDRPLSLGCFAVHYCDCYCYCARDWLVRFHDYCNTRSLRSASIESDIMLETDAHCLIVVHYFSLLMLSSRPLWRLGLRFNCHITVSCLRINLQGVPERWPTTVFRQYFCITAGISDIISKHTSRHSCIIVDCGDEGQSRAKTGEEGDGKSKKDEKFE